MTSLWPRRVPALSAMFTVGLNVVLRHPTASRQRVQCGGYGSRGCAASHSRKGEEGHQAMTFFQ